MSQTQTIGRIFRLLALALIFSGCQRMNREYRDVSAQRFKRHYDEAPTMNYKFIYVGRKHGFHVLDYYGWGTKDWLEYQYSIRTKEEDLPKDFPDHPQPKPQG